MPPVAAHAPGVRARTTASAIAATDSVIDTAQITQTGRVSQKSLTFGAITPLSALPARAAKGALLRSDGGGGTRAVQTPGACGAGAGVCLEGGLGKRAGM